jgi:O-antigen/teichoic acid export membrane protein
MLDLMLPDGEQQVAIYAQAYRLLDASSQIGVLFASLLLPMFAYMIKLKEELHSLIKLSFSLLIIPASVLAIFVFFYASTIVELLYQNNFTETSSVLSLLMMCFVAIATTYIFGTLLTSNGSLKQLNVISIIGLGLNFLLNLILIPKYKAEGAAFTSLITQIIVVLLQLWVCKLIFGFKINLGYLLKIAGVLVVAFVITYVLRNSQINFIWSFFILLLVSGVLVFILKIIQLKELYLLIKNKN